MRVKSFERLAALTSWNTLSHRYCRIQTVYMYILVCKFLIFCQELVMAKALLDNTSNIPVENADK